MQYYYYTYCPRKKLLVILLIGVIIGVVPAYIYFSYEISSLRLELKTTKEKYVKLQQEYASLETKYGEIKAKYDVLLAKYEKLEGNYTRLLEDFRQVKEQLEEIENRSKTFWTQMQEVLYYRLFTLYDYKRGEYYYAFYRIRAHDYFFYRTKVEGHIVASLENRLTSKYILEAVNSWRDEQSAAIQEIAYDLKQISRGDPELYVNLALQLVHQIYYNITGYTKYPLETLVEGSGDCDNVATLLASILRAGGLDTIVLLVVVQTTEGEGGHAMVAVALPSPPTDVVRYGQRYYWYYEYKGKRYYPAEATWMKPGDSAYIHPASPSAFMVEGSFVGDNPWGEGITIKEVVEIP